MNILFSLIGDKDDDDWISQLLSKFEYDHCAVIFRDPKTADKSIVGQRYATEKFFHAKFKQADYSDFSDYMQEAPPVDNEILEMIAPYQSQIMWMMERCVSREYNHRWNDYCKHIRFWNYVLDKLEIDLFVTKVFPHEVYDYIIYILCKIKKIKYITVFPPSYYKTTYFSEDIYNQLPNFLGDFKILEQIYADKTENEIELTPLIQEMYTYYTGEEDRTPYYMKNQLGEFRNDFLRKLCENSLFFRFLRSLKRSDGKNQFARFCYNMGMRFAFTLKIAINFFSFSSMNNYRIAEGFYTSKVFREFDSVFRVYKNNISEVDYCKKYIYVPLQLQPEATSSPLGGVFVDQLLMIKMLAFYVPKDWVIYVKENPKQAMQSHIVPFDSYRTVSFYEELLQLPNVRFVSLKEDTYKLTEKAKAVATLTGTAGLEAITKGIPCLMFGYSYLQYAPNVYHIKTNQDCENAIKSIQDTAISPDYNKKLKLYFKCLEKYIINTTAELDTITDEGEKNIAKSKLADAYYDKICRIMNIS